MSHRFLRRTSVPLALEGDSGFNPKNINLLSLFTGLQVSYILWGIVQENLMTRDYKLGKFRSSAFLVFANRFLALLISLGMVLVQRVCYSTGELVVVAKGGL